MRATNEESPSVQWEVSDSVPFEPFDLTQSKKCILHSITIYHVLFLFHLVIVSFNASCDSITDYMAYGSFPAPIPCNWLKENYSHNEWDS